MESHSPQQLEANTPLDEAIGEATVWTVVLGVVSLLAGIAQLFGLVDAGDVPVWLNLLIPVVAIVLGLALPLRSILLTFLLVAIFIAIVTSTLISTGLVLQSGDYVLGGIILIRYVILISATRSIARVFFGIWEERRISQGLQALGGTETGPVQNDARPPTTATVTLQPATNWSAVYFGALAAFLGFAGVITFFALPFEDIAAVMQVLFLVMAPGTAVLAVMEQRYVPKLIDTLREALATGDAETAQKTRDKLLKAGRKSTRWLAISALEFDPYDADRNRAVENFRFARSALALIHEIGELDADAAKALHMHFVEGHDRWDVQREGWTEVYDAAARIEQMARSPCTPQSIAHP